MTPRQRKTNKAARKAWSSNAVAAKARLRIERAEEAAKSLEAEMREWEAGCKAKG